MKHYFLSSTLAGEKFEKEVSLEEYCRAERNAGFKPKMSSDNPKYMTTPATGGFSSSYGVSGYSTVDWKVTADHPVLARPDKFGLTKIEAVKFSETLIELGYENVKIDIDD